MMREYWAHPEAPWSGNKKYTGNFVYKVYLHTNNWTSSAIRRLQSSADHLHHHGPEIQPDRVRETQIAAGSDRLCWYTAEKMIFQLAIYHNLSTLSHYQWLGLNRIQEIAG